MRGKQNSSCKKGSPRRITPAHAGKTRARASLLTEPTDHPRACGENVRMLRRPSRSVGSPPRMRGKRKRHSSSPHPLRITPAHAGKTEVFRYTHSSTPDHPRACGENLDACLLGRREAGSPPRMRGKLKRPIGNSSLFRITPAHAGKTLVFLSLYLLSEDHPRACGEN